ncbi:MAG TPA: hypothetical protein VJR92_16020 [Gemmatimonadaceae bacterium]|nr:hypothetical protein [Gemmatimonadaceae bacterium]
MKHVIRVAAFAICIPSAALGAQQVQQAQQAEQFPSVALEVQLFPLQFLKPADAAKLISPFVFERNAGVFEAGASVKAITVRASRRVLARVDSLLKVYDEPPVTLNLRFQLIAGSDSAWLDAAIAPDVQNSLRSLFRFAGYRVIAQGVTTVSSTEFMTSLHATDEKFEVSGSVGTISRATAARPASAQLDIRLLSGRTFMLSTGVSIPVGETVIVGSAAGGPTDTQRGRTLILVVKPEPVSRGAR